MAHSTAPQLFATPGRPETLARGNRCDCTLTEPALHVQTALSRAARHLCKKCHRELDSECAATSTAVMRLRCPLTPLRRMPWIDLGIV